MILVRKLFGKGKAATFARDVSRHIAFIVVVTWREFMKNGMKDTIALRNTSKQCDMRFASNGSLLCTVGTVQTDDVEKVYLRADKRKTAKETLQLYNGNIFFCGNIARLQGRAREFCFTTEMLLKHNSDKFNKNSFAVFHPLLSNIQKCYC